MNPLFKLIAGLVAIILGFLVVFVPPVAAVIPGIVGAISSVAGFFGIKSFRNNYGKAKEWFKSKTIVGALAVVIPLIAMVVVPFFNFELPVILNEILTYLIIGGGGLTLYGILDADSNKGSSTVKLLLILMLPLLLVRCSSSVVVTPGEYGVDELEDVVQLYYQGCQEISGVIIDQDDILTAALSLVPTILVAVDEFDMVEYEIQDLSDAEILYLTELSANYNLGPYRSIFEAGCKLLLFSIQTRYNINVAAEHPKILNIAA